MVTAVRKVGRGGGGGEGGGGSERVGEVGCLCKS